MSGVDVFSRSVDVAQLVPLLKDAIPELRTGPHFLRAILLGQSERSFFCLRWLLDSISAGGC